MTGLVVLVRRLHPPLTGGEQGTSRALQDAMWGREPAQPDGSVVIEGLRRPTGRRSLIEAQPAGRGEGPEQSASDDRVSTLAVQRWPGTASAGGFLQNAKRKHRSVWKRGSVEGVPVAKSMTVGGVSRKSF